MDAAAAAAALRRRLRHERRVDDLLAAAAAPPRVAGHRLLELVVHRLCSSGSGWRYGWQYNVAIRVRHRGGGGKAEGSRSSSTGTGTSTSSSLMQQRHTGATVQPRHASLPLRPLTWPQALHYQDLGPRGVAALQRHLAQPHVCSGRQAVVVVAVVVTGGNRGKAVEWSALSCRYRRLHRVSPAATPLQTPTIPPG